MTGANIGHRNFQIALDIGQLKYLGPCTKYPDCWNLEAERGIPMILVATRPDDGPRKAYIYAPTFRPMSVPDHIVVVSIDTIVARMRIREQGLPKRRDKLVRCILDTMAEAQKDDVRTLKGSLEEFKSLLQDAADVTGLIIKVKCGRSGKHARVTVIEGPNTRSARRARPSTVNSISAIIRFFQPIGRARAELGSWMDQRKPLEFAFEARGLTGDDRLEPAGRLVDFFETNAAHIGLRPQDVKRRLEALFSFGQSSKARKLRRGSS